MNDEELKIKEKVEFFFKENIFVHIVKKDKEFLNGHIVRLYSDSVFILNERKLGNISVFLSDIYNIEEFREVKG